MSFFIILDLAKARSDLIRQTETSEDFIFRHNFLHNETKLM